MSDSENQSCLAGVGKGFSFTQREEAMQAKIESQRVEIEELTKDKNAAIDVARVAGQSVKELDADVEQLRHSRNSFREACHKYANGPYLEIRMPGSELDEIVGYGAFHVEQMDDNRWFFMLGSCGFHLHGKKVRLVPLNHNTWAEAKQELSTKDSERHTKDCWYCMATLAASAGYCNVCGRQQNQSEKISD